MAGPGRTCYSGVQPSPFFQCVILVLELNTPQVKPTNGTLTIAVRPVTARLALCMTQESPPNVAKIERLGKEILTSCAEHPVPLPFGNEEYLNWIAFQKVMMADVSFKSLAWESTVKIDCYPQGTYGVGFRSQESFRKRTPRSGQTPFF